ncbi:metal-dependent hydrolase (plasmid) [Halorussus salilacus]|uniref:metal-dependent hydrolase n=1 Tax=Halorussus salilacus TaxID=2953750 RepID=UPI00209D8882|nr:metal-dependent hydrolase [Halorussus salilacus]USZ69702.1 metal-dependent hydrolase [Halorussus salilacus]
MMATTHALVGVALATAVARAAPEFAAVALVAAAVGSVFPDFDLYAGHRKTFHFPVYYSALAVPAGGLALALPSAATIALALFVVGAALHSLMDALGGGLEVEPWRATSDRAVYDHFRGRWVAPRRWIRYDGAPEDLALAGLLGVPAFVVHEPPVRTLVVAVLAVSAGYALLRKPLARLWVRLVGAVPREARAYVPDRFEEATESRARGTRSEAD